MKNKNFTIKNNGLLPLSGLSVSLLLLLSGCVKMENGVPAESGPVNDFLYEPMSKAITYFANNAGLGYGLAIVIVTLIVRTLILPLGLYQSRKAAYQSEKMAYLKPILGPIQERAMNKSLGQEEQMRAQQEYMAAQRAYGVSPFGGIGCFPLLIQMPFFSAIYFATRFTPGISEASFLGIPLGKSSLILTVLTGALYFLQSWLMVQSLDETQQAQMKQTMYMTPIMMIFMSFSMPAGVQLYWVIGGLFAILQQAVSQYMIKPVVRKQIAADYEKNPPKPYPSNFGPATRKDVTQTGQNTQAIQADATRNHRQRNAGKQNKRK